MIKLATIHTTRRGILLVLRASAVALISVALLLFMANKISTTAHEISSARNDFATLTKKYEFFDELKKDNELVQLNEKKLANIFPSLDNLTLIADYVSALGTKNDVTAELRFDAGVTQANVAAGEIPFALRVNGAPDHILKFLAGIETAPYFIEIKMFALTLQDAENKEAALTGSGIVYVTMESDL